MPPRPAPVVPAPTPDTAVKPARKRTRPAPPLPAAAKDGHAVLVWLGGTSSDMRVAANWLDAALEGRPLLAALSLPDQHERFVDVAQAPARSGWGFLELVAVDWLGRMLFAHTWPLVLLGIGLYAFASLRGRLGDDDRRAYLLLVPGLLAAAYVALAALRPFVVFTRFFWLPSLILSVLNVYFRDVQYLVGAILLQALFYLTPVVYPIDLVYDAIGDRKWLERLYTANPTVQFIEAFHRVLYDLRWPTWQNWTYLLAWSAFSLVLGMSVFRRYETRLAEEL